MQKPSRDDQHKEVLTTLFSEGKTVQYARGQALIRPYDEQSVYFITKGFVKAYATTKYGYNNQLCIFKSGEIVPLSGMLGIYNVESYYQAIGPVTAKVLPRSALLYSMRHDPAVAEALLRQLYEVLAVFSSRVNTLELRTIEEKVASRLVLLKARFGVEQDGMYVIPVPLTHQDIADSIAASRETVTRHIHKLIAAGVIEQRDHQIIIKDFTALCSVLE